MQFYLFSFLYLFVFFGSVYGLFVDELTLGLRQPSNVNITLEGWRKNALCITGLLIAALIPTVPLVTAICRALKSGSE